MMDYSYYVNEFGGRLIPQGEFGRVVGEAEELLCALIFPKLAEGMSCEVKKKYLRAVCYEAEFIYERKSRMDGVKSEKVGDYSVEYCDVSTKRGISIHGWEVSPAACNLLLGAGLLTRWV